MYTFLQLDEHISNAFSTTSKYTLTRYNIYNRTIATATLLSIYTAKLEYIIVSKEYLLVSKTKVTFIKVNSGWI